MMFLYSLPDCPPCVKSFYDSKGPGTIRRPWAFYWQKACQIQFQKSVFSFRPMLEALNTGFLPALRCSM